MSEPGVLGSTRIIVNDPVTRKREIWMAIASMVYRCGPPSRLLVASPFLSDISLLRDVLTAIGKRAAQGTDVRLFARPPQTRAVALTMKRLHQQGVKIMLNPLLHAKIFLFEERYQPSRMNHRAGTEGSAARKNATVVIGSANLTVPGLGPPDVPVDQINFEIALKSNETYLFRAVEEVFLRWWEAPSAITFQEWWAEAEQVC